MARLAINRATWGLQVSQTSRNLAVSFKAATPRSHNPWHTDSLFASTSRLHHQRALWRGQTRQFASTTNFRASAEAAKKDPADLANGLSDAPIVLDEGTTQVDWSSSFHGLSVEPFSKEAADVLLAPIPPEDIEVKPDGICYLPEIKYRRILNRAFGPGAWGLAPRGETIVTAKAVTREYALVALGRLVSVARGEQDYFSSDGIPTAAEGCKSNALMRCCKDLGVASELWDPRFIKRFMAKYGKEVWAENAVTKKKKKIYLRKEDPVPYPWKESKTTAGSY